MGYVFDYHDAIAYEKWLNNQQEYFGTGPETRLMLNMLKPFRGETVLDIGCGTGASILPFLELGLDVTGIDPSPYMLDIAYKNIGNRADLHRGVAEDLPFEDNSFNYASLFTTLEFVEDPRKAIEEACRVAKDKVFIGVLNRYAIKGIQRRIKGIFVKTIYNHANFFSIWELKQIIRSLLGDVPIYWRTVSRFSSSNKIFNMIDQFGMLQRSPFGTFTGMVVIPVPRFKTRPLTLKYAPKQAADAITGCAGSIRL